MKYILLLLTAAVILSGCSSGSNVYYDLPVEFRYPDKKAEFLKKYLPFLIGKKIFIDPGHGGTDRKSIGPQKLVVEADANLHVALILRDYLGEAGAVVEMSRDKDMPVDLKERSYMADSSGADIFVSIHHNAPPDKGDSLTNYTSTYYHAKETDNEYEPCERDLARFIQRDLSYAMRNPGGLGSFDGTYSDYTVYPGDGFSVLRVTQIPSVLVECGFFSHPYEEQRLAVEEFNKIEAWGIFRGLAKYFASGIPKIKMTMEPAPGETLPAGEHNFTFLLSDSTGIDYNSISVFWDSTKVTDYTFAEDNPNTLIVYIADMKPGEHEIRVIVANKNGNHSFPFRRKIGVVGK